jgi:hypothetical protein
LQNKEKILISKTIGKNGSVKEVMLWFSSPASRSNPFTHSPTDYFGLLPQNS